MSSGRTYFKKNSEKLKLETAVEVTSLDQMIILGKVPNHLRQSTTTTFASQSSSSMIEQNRGGGGFEQKSIVIERNFLKNRQHQEHQHIYKTVEANDNFMQDGTMHN